MFGLIKKILGVIFLIASVNFLNSIKMCFNEKSRV